MSTSRQGTTKEDSHTAVLTTNTISLLMVVSDLFKIVRRSMENGAEGQNGNNLETPVQALLRRTIRLVKISGIIFALTVICKTCHAQIFGLPVLVKFWSSSLFMHALCHAKACSFSPKFRKKKLNTITMFSKLFIVLTAVIVAVSARGTPTSASSPIVPSLE